MAEKEFYAGEAVAYWKVVNRKNETEGTFRAKIEADALVIGSGCPHLYTVLPVWEKDAMYMNPATGSVDTYDGWWYENEDGEKVNAVDLGEVVAVYKDKDGAWKEV